MKANRSHMKTVPTLAMYRAKDFEDAVEKAEKLVAMGGIGHTSCLYTDQDNQPARVSYLGQKMKTARILINTQRLRVVSVTCITSNSHLP